jgi:hypothetical protein
MKILSYFIIIILVAVVSVFCLCMNMHVGSSAIAESVDELVATAQRVSVDGAEVGEVVIGDEVVFRIRTSAGGLSPYERAQVVAERLNELMREPIQPGSVKSAVAGGQGMVLIGDQLVITADQAHAALNNTTPIQLATLWALQLEKAVTKSGLVETPLAEKVVPIVSIGSGTRIGGALVTGSKDKVDEVRAVAQVEGDFGSSVRVRILVPVSTEDVVKEIRRVPETSVIGLVDIKL